MKYLYTLYTWKILIERPANKFYTYTQIKVKEQIFYCCSTFHSHGCVLSNEYYSYPEMSVKWIVAEQ